MTFSSIAIKTTIPATVPAATSGAFTFVGIEPENWLQITGEASVGAGSLYLLRWNPTLSSTVNWQYISQSTSSAEYATPTGVTISGGTQIGADDVVTQASLSLADLDLRMEPGDVLAVAIQTASSTATVAVSVNQHEE